MRDFFLLSACRLNDASSIVWVFESSPLGLQWADRSNGEDGPEKE